MTILISSDHGGFELKEKIELHYDVREDVPDARNVEIEDLGPHDVMPDDDYPPYAFALCEELKRRWEAGESDTLGILICRSGNGMAIAANKVAAIRAALCFTAEHATKAREHDHANVLVLDADYIPEEQHLKVIDAFIHASPETGGRHERRVSQIRDFEASK
jgi:ribose 5-phosphate isomerase B